MNPYEIRLSILRLAEERVASEHNARVAREAANERAKIDSSYPDFPGTGRTFKLAEEMYHFVERGKIKKDNKETE